MPNSLADNVHEPVLLLLERTLVIFVKEIMVMLAIMRSFLKSVMVESNSSHGDLEAPLLTHLLLLLSHIKGCS